jgi:peptide/nickel transport system permease protein
LAIGIPMGMISAARKSQKEDSTIRVMSSLANSFPVFLSAIVLKLFVLYSFYFIAILVRDTYIVSFVPYKQRFNGKLFSYPDSLLFGLLPNTGFILIDSLLSFHPLLFLDALIHILLPVSVVALSQVTLITRLTRSAMLEALKEDYILMARAKGLSERIVLYRHALRNAIYPLVTIIGLIFSNLLIGTIFAV